MIKFVKASEVLSLRSSVLRDGKPLEECIFPGDDDQNTFHLADIQNETAVCVASFFLKEHPERKGKAYQLRGMATAAEFRNRGVGNQLMNFAIVYLRGLQTDYVWCNARKAAYSFYLGLGFEFISPEFEIEGIGTHRVMILVVSIK